MTGLSFMQDAVSEKKVEILVEALPGLKRLGILSNPDVAITQSSKRAVERAATRFGLEKVLLDVRGPADFREAFVSLRSAEVGAVLVIGSPLTYQGGRELSQLALETRLPSIFPFLEDARAGALMAYGADLLDLNYRCARYVDSILKGAKPADLPVEQPSRFYLVVNVKTALALSLTIPPTLLARADEVIE